MGLHGNYQQPLRQQAEGPSRQGKNVSLAEAVRPVGGPGPHVHRSCEGAHARAGHSPGRHGRLGVPRLAGGSPGDGRTATGRIARPEARRRMLDRRASRCASSSPRSSTPSQTLREKPFVVFGHSLGAWMAYEVCVESKRRGRRVSCLLLRFAARRSQERRRPRPLVSSAPPLLRLLLPLPCRRRRCCCCASRYFLQPLSLYSWPVGRNVLAHVAVKEHVAPAVRRIAVRGTKSPASPVPSYATSRARPSATTRAGPHIQRKQYGTRIISRAVLRRDVAGVVDATRGPSTIPLPLPLPLRLRIRLRELSPFVTGRLRRRGPSPGPTVPGPERREARRRRPALLQVYEEREVLSARGIL